jgi:Protein of unknown function (DUF2851)
MQEEFLHYLWKFRLFDNKDLKTTEDEPIEILKCGEPNPDSGPDFFNARIKVDETLWAGNVEIHLRASDWKAHKHQYDKAYSNVILHVVYEADVLINGRDGEIIPTLELKGRIPDGLYKKYLSFKESSDWIPCGKQIQEVDSFTLNHWFDRLLVERLEKKIAPITDSLRENKNNWEETFYQHLAHSFGLKLNAQPFEFLARSLPLNLLAKHKDNPLQLEALLFGQAGLLPSLFNSPTTEPEKGVYEKQLLKEYSFLKNKFRLKPIDGHLWKFMRLHPPNFPTIRIAQFANLLYKSFHLFSKIIEATNIYSIRALLHAEACEYWDSHYLFGKDSPSQKKILGEETKNILIINTVVPFFFVYGKQNGDQHRMEKALDFLTQLPAEKNSIIANWGLAGIKAANAYQTQALMQLKSDYCSAKRCLECSVGTKLLLRGNV